MGRAPCCDRASVKKGPWSPEEDAQLKDYIQTHGTGGNWIAFPQKAGLKRCGKSCRLRWLNYLRPDIKHGEFSDHEDRIICNLFATIGSRWSVIASQLPGRTDNDIKNYWNTKLKKKMIPFITNNPSPHHHLYQPPLLPLIQNSTPSSSASSPLSSFLENTNSSSYTASHHTSSLFSASDPSISFSSANFSNGHSSFHQPQENLMKMSHHHHHGKKEAAADATTGYYNGGDQTTMVAAHNIGMEETQKVCDGDYYVNGLLWEENPPLDYGLEEIKHLISSTTTTNNNNSCNNNFLFDDNMTHQRALYYY